MYEGKFNLFSWFYQDLVRLNTTKLEKNRYYGPERLFNDVFAERPVTWKVLSKKITKLFLPISGPKSIKTKELLIDAVYATAVDTGKSTEQEILKQH